MKIVREETLISCGEYASSAEWKRTRATLYKAIREVEWPVGFGKFTIYPESGKARGRGNGVKPIKLGLMQELKRRGWKLEEPLAIAILKKPGNLDAVLYTSSVQWLWSGKLATFPLVTEP